jgi:hypothetical protein
LQLVGLPQIGHPGTQGFVGGPTSAGTVILDVEDEDVWVWINTY